MCMVCIWHQKRAHETPRCSQITPAEIATLQINAPHLDDLRHPHDPRASCDTDTDCDSARQRPARPARDTSRAASQLGSRTPAVEHKAHRSLSAQINYTMRAPYIRIGSRTAPRPSISIVIPMYCTSRSSLLTDSLPILYFPFPFPFSLLCNNSIICTFPLPVQFPPTPCTR